MLAVQTLLTVTILVLFFVKFRIGLCVYIAYIFLVPYCSINIGGLSLGWNLMNTALLLAYCINCNRKFGKIQFSYKPFIPFFILYGLLLMEMPFQDGVPMEFAIDKWRLDVFNLILPIVVFSTSQYDNKIGKHSLVTMVLVCIVVIVYAFILIPLQGLNPYSTFTHPMTFGAFLGMAVVYIYSYIGNNKNVVLLCVLVGLLSCIFFCGIRTPIAALFITIAVYLLQKKNFKTFLYASMIGVIGYFIIIQFPALSETILSMTDSDGSDVGGSSIEMRLEQLDAAFSEVQDCMAFGKGYGYNSYYWSIHGTHPRLYSFESLVFVILCNYGLVGFLIWGIMFYKIFRISKQMREKSLGLFIMLLITYYISFTCITGEYGYMKYFLLFYSLLIINRQTKYKFQNKF